MIFIIDCLIADVYTQHAVEAKSILVFVVLIYCLYTGHLAIIPL